MPTFPQTEDSILSAVVILGVKWSGKSIDEVLLAMENAGLVDHTYIERSNGKVDADYRFTPKGLGILEDAGAF